MFLQYPSKGQKHGLMSYTPLAVYPLLPPLVLRKQSHRSIDTPCTRKIRADQRTDTDAITGRNAALKLGRRTKVIRQGSKRGPTDTEIDEGFAGTAGVLGCARPAVTRQQASA